VKTKKPTGDAYCPPEVKRAHQIDELITERSYTCEISDDELDGSDNAAEVLELQGDDVLGHHPHSPYLRGNPFTYI
jgi:hypothetical protein